jgi:hypothetical protein
MVLIWIEIGIIKIIDDVTLNACATVAAATDGVAFGHLVVVFLERIPRCIRAAKLGALWLIGEIRDTRRRSNGRPLLLIIGAGSSTSQMKESAADEVRSKEKTKCWEKAYHIIRDLVLEIDHVPLCMSRCCEQLSFPFLPP